MIISKPPHFACLSGSLILSVCYTFRVKDEEIKASVHFDISLGFCPLKLVLKFVLTQFILLYSSKRNMM
jgi:hypothetical protein